MDYSSLTVTSKSSSGSTSSGSSSGSSNLTQKSSSPSSNSLTNTSGNLTVQPTYISGGKGGNTYIVTYADGTQNQIAASGQSLADTAKYYQEKADKAAARGNTAQAAKYQKSANEFSAAANYESTSRVTETYGTGTGITYDATASIQLNKSGTGVVVADTALKYEAGNGVDGSYQTTSLGAKTVSTTLIDPKNQSPQATSNAAALVEALDSGNPSDLSWMSEGTAPLSTGSTDPIRYQWDDSKGFLENLVEGTAYNFNKNIVEPLASGGIAGLINNAPAYIEASKAEAGKAVDDYIDWSDSLVVSDNLGVRAAGTALAILAPNEFIRNAKRVTDGKADEITLEDIVWSALDALALVPGVALAKVGKIGKVAKVGTYGSQGVLAAVPAITAFNEAYNGTPDYTQLLSNSGYTGYDSLRLGDYTPQIIPDNGGWAGDTDILNTPVLPAPVVSPIGGGESTIPSQIEYPSYQITPNTQYSPNYNIPNEQSAISPQNSEDLELSTLLSAALAGIYSGKSSGSGGGNGGVTVINETSGNGSGGSSGISNAIEQFAPYIIPTALVVGGIILLSNLGKSSNKKGATA